MGRCCRHSLPCHLLCLFVLAQLLTSVSTEQFLVFGPSDPIVAVPGGEAILSCSMFPAMNVENMEELRWFRRRFSEAVFVYRDQQEQKGEQMAVFSGRTSLVKDQFHQGKAAVRIHNIQESDSGMYICYFKQGLFYEEAIMELKVAVMGSVPEVYIKGPEDGGICVVCKASGWYPKPQVQWRDHRGENLPASSETHTEDAEGLFSVETSLVVRDSSLGNVTCSTLNLILGQEKVMAIVISEPFFPQVSPWRVAFVVTLVMLGLLALGTGCFLRRERSARLKVQREWESLQCEKEGLLKTKKDALRTTSTQTPSCHCFSGNSRQSLGEDIKENKKQTFWLSVPGNDSPGVVSRTSTDQEFHQSCCWNLEKPEPRVQPEPSISKWSDEQPNNTKTTKCRASSFGSYVYISSQSLY